MRNYILFYLPFLLFSLTYIYLIFYYKKDKIIVPQLSGLLLTDLILDLKSDLVFKIVKVTYNKEYEDNYIISQYPSPGSLMTSNQIINLEVNNNKNKIYKNVFFNNKNDSIDIIAKNCKKEGISYKIVNIDLKNYLNFKEISAYDKNKNLTYIYCNKNINEQIYIKNFIGLNCRDLYNEGHSIICFNCVNNKIENCSGMKIKSQFPLPGIGSKIDKNIVIHVWHK